MRIIGIDVIDDYKERHANSVKPLTNWVKLVQLATWQTPQDIKNALRSADFLPDNVVIFNIGGNNFRVVVEVAYVAGVMVILWVGTHAEYSKKRF